MLKHLYLNNFHLFSYSMLIKDYVFALRAHWYGLELIFFMTLDGRKHFEPVKSAWSFYSELKASVLHPVEGNNNGIRTNTHREKVEEGAITFNMLNGRMHKKICCYATVSPISVHICYLKVRIGLVD